MKLNSGRLWCRDLEKKFNPASSCCGVRTICYLFLIPATMPCDILNRFEQLYLHFLIDGTIACSLYVWMNGNICKCAYIDSVFLCTSCLPWFCKQRMSDETWWSICIEQKAEWLGQWGRLERVKKKSGQWVYSSGFCFQEEKTKVNWLRPSHWNHMCL